MRLRFGPNLTASYDHPLHSKSSPLRESPKRPAKSPTEPCAPSYSSHTLRCVARRSRDVRASTGRDGNGFSQHDEVDAIVDDRFERREGFFLSTSGRSAVARRPVPPTHKAKERHWRCILCCRSLPELVEQRKPPKIKLASRELAIDRSIDRPLLTSDAQAPCAGTTGFLGG
jgi:hypothetical protein